MANVVGVKDSEAVLATVARTEGMEMGLRGLSASAAAAGAALVPAGMDGASALAAMNHRASVAEFSQNLARAAMTMGDSARVVFNLVRDVQETTTDHATAMSVTDTSLLI